MVDICLLRDATEVVDDEPLEQDEVVDGEVVLVYLNEIDDEILAQALLVLIVGLDELEDDEQLVIDILLECAYVEVMVERDWLVIWAEQVNVMLDDEVDEVLEVVVADVDVVDDELEVDMVVVVVMPLEYEVDEVEVDVEVGVDEMEVIEYLF